MVTEPLWSLWTAEPGGLAESVTNAMSCCLGGGAKSLE